MSEQKNFYELVAKVQETLKAPKGQRNKFGNYNYRSCEDILEAVKPILGDLIITITDDIMAVSDRIYVKATATISDGVNSLSTTAFAREPLTKKGMDESQITGAASSYARKYALNGLLLIDDTKDADTQDNRKNQSYQKNDRNGEIINKLGSILQERDANPEQYLPWISKGCGREINELAELTAPEAEKVINALEARK